MNRLLLSTLLIMLVFTACSEAPQGVEPGSTPDQAASKLTQMQLNEDQALLLDEMYVLGEDLGILLSPNQIAAFDGMITDLRGGPAGSRLEVDVAAITYLNLVLKANPDLSEETKAALVKLLRESMQRRQRILNSDLSREEKLRLLTQEHEKLIAMMNRLIGETGVQNVRRLIERLQQERRDREQKYTQLRIERQVKMLTETLQLSEDQAAKLTRILNAQYADILKLREQFAGDPEGFRNALLRLKAKYGSMIEELLTPEQLRRWKAMQGDTGGRAEINPVKQQVELMTKLLELNDQQVAGVTRLLTWQQEQMKLLRAQYQNDPRGLMKALEELQAQVDRKLAGVLTPEQLKAWLAYRARTGTTRP